MNLADFNNDVVDAARDGHLCLLEHWKKNGFPIGGPDENGFTSLMGAVQGEKAEVVRFLVDEVANVDAASPAGWTALMIAAHQGNAELVRILVDRGANVNATGPSGWTALMVAAHQGDREVVEALVTTEVNVDAEGPHGRTALMIAAQQGNAELVQFLMGKGANVNAADHVGWTAFMLAAERGNAEVVEALAAAGVNMDADDRHGWTLLMIAAKRGDAELVEYLLLAGAKVGYANERGSTALHLAVIGEYEQVASILLKHGLSEKGWTPPQGLVNHPVVLRAALRVGLSGVARNTDDIPSLGPIHARVFANALFASRANSVKGRVTEAWRALEERLIAVMRHQQPQLSQTFSTSPQPLAPSNGSDAFSRNLPPDAPLGRGPMHHEPV